MEPDTTPVATVTGLYRGTNSGLEPLTKETPLTLGEVRSNPVFYELDLCPDLADADLIIDIIYDNMNPVRLQDLFRGTDIPRGMRFWPDWFEIPPYREIRDINHRMIYPRALGIHTVRFRTALRKTSQRGRKRDFSSANRGYTSPVFEFEIAPEVNNGCC
jgi:hypothetical protein